jgi:hypothetical protein
MTMEYQLRSQRWRQLIEQIESEYQQLPDEEKIWIAARLQQIETLQQQLHRLFTRGQGERACASCLGGCCAKGHNHMTLPNLLSFLQSGKQPPPVDFSRTCPFLSDTGCLLPITCRPYNCISFVCDIIEENLIQEEQERFYATERQLRNIYLQFADRYVGAAMTGLLIQEQRLGNRAFFSRKRSLF